MAYSRSINSGEGTSRPTVTRAKQSVKTEKTYDKKGTYLKRYEYPPQVKRCVRYEGV